MAEMMLVTQALDERDLLVKKITDKISKLELLDCKRRNVPAFLLMPWIRLLAKLFLKLDLRARTDDVLSDTTIPCFFLHGTNDRTVPFETGRAVYARCGAGKAIFTADGAGHTEAFLSDPEKAENALFTFLGEEPNS